ncbi:MULTISPECIES: hypothetical protein [Thermoanaerobacter]|jgi:hypothetical protein|uniref:Uncharacterized protein n=1 Tax=Thermoanaerobacter brockii subsp. finnii (strain ATCC 43586 / DSM 3389 / AKO-1) TaxID=509193 RepID=E8UT70_THEBF|nr:MULTISPECIES: hypothetical protein [Thermoanaerobacter]ADV78679.1 hypothetical protein Thebr_0047 [Thermoanaerobacter brockii subsp. finnii Ako-1]HBW60398.1 hypothetical protein [Thermoanaerobacter sp.]
MIKERDLDYKGAWELMKQMVDYYTGEKKYLTRREIKYIIQVCENKDKNIVKILNDIEGGI